MNTYVCSICGYIYEEAAGIPGAGIAPGTRWEDLPENWVCPLCKAAKSAFNKKEPETVKKPAAAVKLDESALGEFSVPQLAAICSNLARGCEKQYLSEESELFTQLAEYFTDRIPQTPKASPEEVLQGVKQDLQQTYPNAWDVARANEDRGAQRALTWSEKVSRILDSLLEGYLREGDALLDNANIYVCEVCGFVYIGQNPPELCPVCKVPSWKFHKVERR